MPAVFLCLKLKLTQKLNPQAKAYNNASKKVELEVTSMQAAAITKSKAEAKAIAKAMTSRSSSWPNLQLALCEALCIYGGTDVCNGQFLGDISCIYNMVIMVMVMVVVVVVVARTCETLRRSHNFPHAF